MREPELTRKCVGWGVLEQTVTNVCSDACSGSIVALSTVLSGYGEKIQLDRWKCRTLSCCIDAEDVWNCQSATWI